MDRNNIFIATLAALALTCGAVLQASAQQAPVLDPEKHPASPAYQSAFPASIVSLDAKLSWNERFLGDERFNEQEVLVQSGNLTQHRAMEKQGAGKGMSMISANGMSMDATGTIRQVRSDKLKIEHGPIDRLGMPAMTMMFKVSDPTMLEGLDKGQEVGFSVDNSSGGFVITHLMLMGEPMSGAATQAVGSLDASGTVRQVRMDQGKVKIKHGPIERLGMPAMTMVFKVKDPAMLQGLAKDSAVEFSVDNSSGGFVITEIKPAQ